MFKILAIEIITLGLCLGVMFTEEFCSLKEIITGLLLCMLAINFLYVVSLSATYLVAPSDFSRFIGWLSL